MIIYREGHIELACTEVQTNPDQTIHRVKNCYLDFMVKKFMQNPVQICQAIFMVVCNYVMHFKKVYINSTKIIGQLMCYNSACLPILILNKSILREAKQVSSMSKYDKKSTQFSRYSPRFPWPITRVCECIQLQFCILYFYLVQQQSSSSLRMLCIGNYHVGTPCSLKYAWKNCNCVLQAKRKLVCILQHTGINADGFYKTCTMLRTQTYMHITIYTVHAI